MFVQIFCAPWCKTFCVRHWFHDNLRFENEGEGDLYDSDDDYDDHVQNAGINPAINIPTDEFSMDETIAIENTARISVETPLDSLVEIISPNSNIQE